MSYGASNLDADRLAGTCVGSILKGDKPADAPPQQSLGVELILNLPAYASASIPAFDFGEPRPKSSQVWSGVPPRRVLAVAESLRFGCGQHALDPAAKGASEPQRVNSRSIGFLWPQFCDHLLAFRSTTLLDVWRPATISANRLSHALNTVNLRAIRSVRT
jgi:hypothetical protein